MVAELTGVHGLTAAWRWELMLPPGWITLPTDREAARGAVKALVGRPLGHLPRDRVATARRQLERELRQLLAQARDAGARSVHAHFGLVRGLPVTATCTVTLVEGGVDDPRLIAQLGAGLAADETVVEIDVRPLVGLPAIRRRRRRLQPVDGSPKPVVSTGLDWAVPLPDGEGAVLMSLATVTEPVADELVVLFDAIAGSLTLERAGG